MLACSWSSLFSVPCYSVDLFFLCSNAQQMPANVRDALKDAFQQEGGVSPEDGEQMLVALERSGRLQSETWSWSHDFDPHLVWVHMMTDSTARTVSCKVDFSTSQHQHIPAWNLILEMCDNITSAQRSTCYLFTVFIQRMEQTQLSSHD